ncbi:hypothetical protein [Microscilla marina]|uniref:Uncharacterized protein n=1 Tax=Microscilla marina ATCC 23134 TaxID=313606 RepID=A1ZJZ1_MICM2|nr:hypothetical protein [Microscilla marina]EAY29444.1 hypothetical protein M23134_01504 [Microscilla marina ATCC 23134]
MRSLAELLAQGIPLEWALLFLLPNPPSDFFEPRRLTIPSSSTTELITDIYVEEASVDIPREELPEIDFPEQEMSLSELDTYTFIPKTPYEL